MSYDLEDDLRRALRRKEPSRDLMPRGATKHSGHQWRWAVAAGVLVTMLGGYEYRAQQHAKEQLMVALKLTGTKLAMAQKHVKRMQ